jgi:hypothetical protein
MVSAADFQDSSFMQISRKILRDLTDGIFLLSPRTAFAAVSPMQANTLSQLYMQRGALYRITAKKLGLNGSLGAVNDRMMNGGTGTFRWIAEAFIVHFND